MEKSKMKILDFLNNIKHSKLTKLENKTYDTIQEYYDECLSKYLPSEETIKGWDDILKRYLSEDKKVFFIRKYETAKEKRWDLIRRGFLTEHSNNISYVYCDNFFAQYFYAMAIEDFVPEYVDFLDVMMYPLKKGW